MHFIHSSIVSFAAEKLFATFSFVNLSTSPRSMRENVQQPKCQQSSGPHKEEAPVTTQSNVVGVDQQAYHPPPPLPPEFYQSYCEYYTYMQHQQQTQPQFPQDAPDVDHHTPTI